MTDNLSKITLSLFTPSDNPSVLPNSPPPQEVAIDPIPPLPSMSSSAANPPTKFGVPESKVETVIVPTSPKPAEIPKIAPVPPVTEEDPGFIRPPGDSSATGNKSRDPYVKKHNGLSKVTIATISSLVFLVIAGVGGLYLTRQQGVGEIRKQAEICTSDSGHTGNCNDCGWENQGQCGVGNSDTCNCNSGNAPCDSGFESNGAGGCRVPGSGGGGSGEPSPTPTPDYGSYEYITFTCDRCASDRRCQTPDIGVNPRYSTGSASGSCAQVDRRPSGGSWEVVSLCDQSCSGLQPTSLPEPTATLGPTESPQPTDIPTSIPPLATPTSILIPSATPTPETISANCDSLVPQMSDGAGGWTTKTDVEFAASARPGDGVRFVCTGAKTGGNFTKSAFFINGILHVDDVVKLNADQYAVEYTIPAAGELEVESVLLHDTKGWVD